MARRREDALGPRVGRDRDAFAAALGLLVDYYHVADMDEHRVGVYDQGLRGVPGELVKRAALRAIETRLWFPKVAELRADAEYCRLRLLADCPYEPCARCEVTPGWEPTMLDGVLRLGRCPCWTAWQTALGRLGVPADSLAVPAAETPLDDRGRAYEGQGD